MSGARTRTAGARSTALALGLATVLLGAACAGDEPEVWLETLPARGGERGRRVGEGIVTDLLDAALTDLRGGGVEVEPVELRPPELEENVVEELRRSRRGDTRRLSDLRRAWVAPVDSAFEGALGAPAGGAAGTLRVALALTGAEGLADAHGGARVTVLLALHGGQHTEELATRELALADAPSGAWLELDLELPAVGPSTRLVVASRWDGEGAPPDGLAVALGAPHVQWADSDAPPVLVVSVDTLRADRLGCYGYERDTSPAIDRLAEHGARFEACTSQSPWTLPAYGSLFTALYPAEHRAGISEKADIWTEGGVASDYSKAGESLADGVATLAGYLARAGYRTAAFYANPFLNPKSGLGRGFDEYVWFKYGAGSGVDLALAWLERHRGLPTFLFVQVTDPHWPYAPPAPFDERFAGRRIEELEHYPPAIQSLRNNAVPEARRALLSDLYDGEVAYTDRELGRLFGYLERTGAWDDGLIVFQSDHGEELWDHGGFEHGHTLYDELLRVPLIVSFPPRVEPGTVVANHVRTVDVMPTVLDLLGLEPPWSVRGTSLVPILSGEADHVQLVGYAEAILWGRPYVGYDEAKALIADGRKLVVPDGGGPALLFDLGDDPGETRDLAGEEPEAVARFEERLRELYREARGRGTRGAAMEMAESEREELRNLGYVDEDDGGDG